MRMSGGMGVEARLLRRAETGDCGGAEVQSWRRRRLFVLYQRLASVADQLHGTFYYCFWEEMMEAVTD